MSPQAGWAPPAAVGSAAVLVGAVLLGAPLTGATAAWATMQAVFTAWPLAAAAAADGDPASAGAPLYDPAAFAARRAAAAPAVLSAAGAWAGAIAAPLDWDVPWQVWPVASTYGAVAGLVAGHALVAGSGVG